MRNFTALLLVFHLISMSNIICESKTSQDHYCHRTENSSSGSNHIPSGNRVQARSKTCLIDEPNQTRKLETETLERIANATYLKVMPCLKSAWIMDSWQTKNFSFPLDAEEHFKNLTEKTEIFRNTRIHRYANYGGTWYIATHSIFRTATLCELLARTDLRGNFSQ